MKRVFFETTNPTKHQVLEVAKLVVLRDTPIVAAARQAQVDLLATLIRKYLPGIKGLADYIGAPVLTPEEEIVYLQSRG